MIINITTHCTLRCPHCMQNAGPERNDYMSEETFRKALDFAYKIGSRVVNISGGEPTSHPRFLDFLKIAVSHRFDNYIVCVLSNGTFLRNREQTEELARLVQSFSGRLKFQVSSYKGLYDNYDEVHKPHLKALRTFGGNLIIEDDMSQFFMKPYGRAESGEWFEMAKKRNGFPSCINAALLAAQKPEQMGIQPGRAFEDIARFCAPMVIWDGSIKLGEAERCKVVANVNDDMKDILDAIASFRPCGGCLPFKWHLENPKTEQEKQVCHILWPDRW